VKKFEALLEEFRTHTHASSPLGTLDECSLNWKFEEIKKKQQQIRQKYPDEERFFTNFASIKWQTSIWAWGASDEWIGRQSGRCQVKTPSFGHTNFSYYFVFWLLLLLPLNIILGWDYTNIVLVYKEMIKICCRQQDKIIYGHIELIQCTWPKTRNENNEIK